MATIQRSTSKVANRLISYAENRAEVKAGVNCPHEYAKSQFKATRELWGKNDGIQAHHVIQSFAPGEVTPELANELGQVLAKEIAEGHEAVVYTHTDKDHIHNHIVINSVNFENGYKYHAHGTDELMKIREASDNICKAHNLSIVEEKSMPVRYTLTEKALIDKKEFSWKDDIRSKVDSEKQTSKSYEEFKQNMMDKHGIEVKERGKHTTYINHETGKRVRGNKLGELYERETIKHEFTKHAERELERKLGFDEYLFGQTTDFDRGEDERITSTTAIRSEQLHARSVGIGEGSAGKNTGIEKQQRIHGIIGPEIERFERNNKQESERTVIGNGQGISGNNRSISNEPQEYSRETKQKLRTTHHQNESTPSRPTGIRDDNEARKQTDFKGKTHGEWDKDRDNRPSDLDSVGDSNTSSSIGDGILEAIQSAQTNQKDDSDLEKQRQKSKKKSKKHTLEDELEL